jgi:hypothetical protein
MVKSIHVILRGGLGNQLFQYAAGVAESSRRGHSLVLETLLLPDAETNSAGLSSWPQNISQFNHFGEISRRPGRLRGLFRRVTLETLRRLGAKWPKLAATVGVFAYEGESESHKPSKIRNLRVINSYVANPRYFEGYEDEIRAHISALVEPTASYRLASETINSGLYTGVHIRLGDYKNLEHIYGTYSSRYLRACITLLEDSSRLGKIVLFSDDRAEATNILLEAGLNPSNLESFPTLSALEELLLLSQCSNIVGSNSTFSWWAAFLNTQDRPRVFFPRPFFVSSDIPEPKTLLLPHWIQVGR